MIIKTQEDLLRKIEEWKDVQFFGCDIETEMISDTKPIWALEIFGIGFHNGKEGFYVPIHPIYSGIDILVLQKLFEGTSATFHNANFDLAVLENYGFDFSRCAVHDTKIMSVLLDENRMSHRLKDLAVSILKVEKPTLYDDVAFNPMELFPHEKIEKMGMYCIDDCSYTYRLFEEFKPKLEEQGLWKLYERMEIPLMHIIRAMQRRGIMLDTEMLMRKDARLQEDIIQAQSDIWKLAGKEFNIGSSDQVGEVLFGIMRISGGQRSEKTGRWTLPESKLQELVEGGHEIAKRILRFRELTKLRNTYTQGLNNLAVDNVIYAQFNQLGARTGRFSSSKPNLQQIPRRDDEYNIRECFVARPGYSFIIADYSQVELRVLAHFTQDTNMVQAYNDGKDIHQLTADLVGCTRQAAKSINFGIIYGMGAYSLANTLKITVDEAERFMKNYFAQFPTVRGFIDASIKQAYAQGYTTTFTGRRRRLNKELYQKTDPKLQKHAERQAVNFRIQGSAADIVKITMRNIFEKIQEYDAHILLQIHDELLVEVLDEQVPIVEAIIKEQMEHSIELAVPLLTEPCITKVWKK